MRCKLCNIELKIDEKLPYRQMIEEDTQNFWLEYIYEFCPECGLIYKKEADHD